MTPTGYGGSKPWFRARLRSPSRASRSIYAQDGVGLLLGVAEAAGAANARLALLCCASRDGSTHLAPPSTLALLEILSKTLRGWPRGGGVMATCLGRGLATLRGLVFPTWSEDLMRALL